MSTLYFKRDIDNIWMELSLSVEFNLSASEAETLLNKIYAQYDFTDITDKELIDYAWDNISKLQKDK